MPFSDAQLETWSHQGSITQSATTYKAIRNAILAAGSPVATRRMDVFLQGSYGNDTNIWSESDVDIVVKLDEIYYSNSESLPADQYLAWQGDRIQITYSWSDFKLDVFSALFRTFGGQVQVGNRALTIGANGGRRKADVLVCTTHRYYDSYSVVAPNNYVEGICFWDSANQQLVNYPKQHSANLTAKHQRTFFRFKPVVRTIKNMRSRMIERGLIREGQAPSYFVEGLLYNVPDALFTANRRETLVRVINWLNHDADLTQLVCANEQLYLLRDHIPTCWPIADGVGFINALTQFWDAG